MRDLRLKARDEIDELLNHEKAEEILGEENLKTFRRLYMNLEEQVETEKLLKVVKYNLRSLFEEDSERTL